MSIRLRHTDGTLVALCAARSVEKPGDVYLDDGEHYALMLKFARDFNWSFEIDLLPTDPESEAIVDREESNNTNRDDWDELHAAEVEAIEQSRREKRNNLSIIP